MELAIVSIGNSKGIRLSKTILEKGYMILKPVAKPRKGWESSFKKMHDKGDDALLMNDVFENEI